MATRVDTLEPLPTPDPVGRPQRRLSPGEWMRENLFSTWFNSLLTVVFGALVLWALYRVGRFVFLDARWEIVRQNITLIMVFRFPREELWRLWLALFLLAASFGFASGVSANARRAAEEEGRVRPEERRLGLALRRAGPLVALVAVFLWFARSPVSVALVLGIVALGVGCHLAGRVSGLQRIKWAVLAGLAGVVLAYLAIVAFDGVGWNRWGGVLLTVFLAVGGILLSFPFGVLLGLGRRSSFPAVRLVCIVYIELVRGVPLIAILFMGAFMLGFFLPPGSDTPSLATRALVGLIVFTAAYIAEIVRGGLQSVPRGQIEAAQALGLSPLKTTRLIVLPQALRAVIPALVGQFISLFKDTSLVAVIGLIELLGVMRALTAQQDFIAQGLIVETLLFASFLYWAGSYWMSRESQRLEQRLGVGVR